MQSPGDAPQPEDDLPVGGAECMVARVDYNDQALTCPGLIQPHGVLMVVDPDSLVITAVSENAPDLFDLSCKALLQQSLGDLLTSEELAPIVHWGAQEPGHRRSFVLKLQKLILSIHQVSAGWICEFEPLQELIPDLGAFDSLRVALEQIMAADHVQQVLDLAVERCCSLTGFERGMAYRFDAQDSGEVLAEVKPEGAIAYLGLHFPATDIPEPVRQMYLQGPVRYVPDLKASFQPVLTDSTVLLPRQIDLSRSLLRSVNDCCIAYHQTMGVEALIVIPLCVDQELWGLIALHHSQPRYLPLHQRDLLGLLGQSVSLALANRLKVDTLAYETRLKRLQAELIYAFSQSEKFEEILIQPNRQLLELVQAQGVALCLKNGITLIGETPNGDDVLELFRWAQTQVSESIYVTNQLPLEYEPAKQYKQKASGILLLQISEQQNLSILWFRPEQQQQITWAGNPHESVLVDASGQLGPRQSFEHWQELIQYTSQPWLEAELDNARGLRAAISGVALQRADELARINQELEQSNEELASFAYAASHDLKEPLRGIYNYTTFLIEDYAELLDEAGIERMQALLRLTKRMDQLIDALLKFAQMRQSEFILREVDLQRLLDSVVDSMRISRADMTFEVIVPRPLPTISSDPILLRELYSNLLSNALKYNESVHKSIEIGYLTPDEQVQAPKLPVIKRAQKMLFYVRDNGIGIRPRHQKSIFRLFKRLHARDRYGGGTGAGLTIVKKVVERHGGEIGVASVYGEGTTFWFSLT